MLLRCPVKSEYEQSLDILYPVLLGTSNIVVSVVMVWAKVPIKRVEKKIR